MRKFTKGLLIFSVLLFIAGAGCVIAGFAMGISSGDVEALVEKYVPYLNEKYIEYEESALIEEDVVGENQDGNESKADALSGMTYEYPASEVNELELDFTNVDCRILASDSDKIMVNVKEEKNYVNVSLSGGSLEVECDPNFWNEKETVHIDVYLPANVTLGEFYLTAGAGKVSMETPIDTKNAFMEMGAGKIVCSSTFKAEKFELEVGAGSSEFALVDASDLHVENAAGTTKMNLAGQKEMYNVTMEIAAGTIRYGEDATSIYSGLANGFTDRPKDAVKDLEIECSAGAVEIGFDGDVVSA